MTSLQTGANERATDYIIHTEMAITALGNTVETLSDGLLIAMIMEVSPELFKPFSIHITQSNKEIMLSKFKTKLRSDESREIRKFH